jgi:hypothetical protein
MHQLIEMLQITESTIVNNVANNGSDDAAGGGIYISNIPSDVTSAIKSTLISGNQVEDVGPGAGLFW